MGNPQRKAEVLTKKKKENLAQGRRREKRKRRESQREANQNLKKDQGLKDRNRPPHQGVQRLQVKVNQKRVQGLRPDPLDRRMTRKKNLRKKRRGKIGSIVIKRTEIEVVMEETG